MHSFQSLPPEVWFAIVENLYLTDLSSLCKAFASRSLNTDIPSIATTHAVRILHNLVTTGMMKVDIGINGDGKDQSSPTIMWGEFNRRGQLKNFGKIPKPRRPYYSRLWRAIFERSFKRLSTFKAKMTTLKINLTTF